MGVSSSAEFVAKWNAQCGVVTSSPESSTSQARKRSLSLSPTPTPTTTNQQASTSDPYATHVTPPEDVSPSKRMKYIKEGIDESIERARKGEV